MSIFITILFIIVPFFAVPFIFVGIALDKKHGFIYAFLLALVVAILAYNFIPNELQDLYRYHYLMENQYSQLTLAEYAEIMFSNNKFLFTLICFIIAQTGNYHLLSFSIVLIGYFIVFYTILDYTKLKKISSYVTILIIIAFMGIFYFINFFSGLAQFLGIAIAFLAFYLEYIKNKKGIGYKLLYFLPMLIHSTLVIIPLARLILQFDFKKIRKFIYIALIIFLVSPSILYLLIDVFKNNIILSTLLTKIDSYLIVNFKTWAFDYGILAIVLLGFYAIVYYFTAKKMRTKMPEKFCDLIHITMITLIAFVQYFDIFTRFINLLILLMNIYLLQVFDEKKKINLIFLIMLTAVTIYGITINANVWLQNDFNHIFQEIGSNIFYMFQ